MMYSYCEEWLHHCWRVYNPKVPLKYGEGSFGRYKDVVKGLGIDLESQQWNKLQNAEKIRNCLLHANGRVSLCKNPQEIKNTIKRERPGLEIIKDRVIISCDYLQRFNETIRDTLNKMQKNGVQHDA